MDGERGIGAVADLVGRQDRVEALRQRDRRQDDVAGGAAGRMRGDASVRQRGDALGAAGGGAHAGDPRDAGVRAAVILLPSPIGSGEKVCRAEMTQTAAS